MYYIPIYKIPYEYEKNKFAVYDLNKNSILPISKQLFNLLKEIYFNGDIELPNFLFQKLESINVVSHSKDYRYYDLSLSGIFRSNKVYFQTAVMNREGGFVVLGVPFDLGASVITGSRMAPEAIRRGSRTIFNYHQFEKYRLSRRFIYEQEKLNFFRLSDVGDLPHKVTKSKLKTFSEISHLIEIITKTKKFPIAIGGDHSILYGEIKGLLSTFKKFGVIQIDAHDDYAGKNSRENDETEIDHANFWSFLENDNRIECIVKLGVRQASMDLSTRARRYNIEQTINLIKHNELKKLPQIPFFLSVDIDSLDPSVVSSVGTPLPGGFGYRELKMVIQNIFYNLNIIGADVVEYMGNNRIEDGIVANLIFDIINFSNQSKNKEEEV